ncbi:hypothetical protein G6F43_002956 [Rhizopus delemar]|nr:hypothetical protein G6F43_002956 [Rhizopus delemar]
MSEQIFGSSRKIQFIGLSKPPLAPAQQQKDQMSIESLLTFSHPRQSQTASTNDITIDNLLTCDVKEPTRKRAKKTSKMTCYYGAVAQKSYGSEKRFLCPPPLVQVHHSTRNLLLSMSILCEDQGLLEQRAILDENQRGSFRYLHVTGTAKAKQFKLQLNLLQPEDESPLATFLTKPITIISKPSKKIGKTARGTTSCISTEAPVSLFSRINSQTVRTKYMTSVGSKLCAKHSIWSPFDILLLRQPQPTVLTTTKKTSKRYNTARLQFSTPASAAHLMYGSEIILRESHTGVSSAPLMVCKVDRGRIVPDACGPVSQMQKVALRLLDTTEKLYLSCPSIDDQTWLDSRPSTLSENGEQVDDALCWTMVGIHVLEDHFDEPPARPYPVVTRMDYQPNTHTLELFGHNLHPSVQPWLGTHGPLSTRLMQPNRWSIALPPLEQLVGELPLLMVRQDGLVYHTGKTFSTNSCT